MTPARIPFPYETLDDLLVRLGGISPERVWLKPAPGTATVRDLTFVYDRYNRPVELVEGTLVQRATSFRASLVATDLMCRIMEWDDVGCSRGVTAGAGCTLQLLKGVVRVPSVSFISWDRFPNRRIPDEPVPKIAPNLAVELLCEGNTAAEMARKLGEYFLSGVQLVWYIDPRARTVRVFTSPDDVTELDGADTLNGGAVLPGFAVEVARLFDQLPPAPKPAKPTKASGKKPKKRK